MILRVFSVRPDNGCSSSDFSSALSYALSFPSQAAWVRGYCRLRAALFKLHLQNYLELASLRVEDLRKETGRISILQLRKKVSTIFSFYGGVAVQYMAPVVVLLCLSVLMHVSLPYQRESLTPEQLEVEPSSNVFRSSGFGLSMFHGCLSFLCWWGCFTVFVASGFGSALRAYILMMLHCLCIATSII